MSCPVFAVSAIKDQGGHDEFRHVGSELLGLKEDFKTDSRNPEH